jgi:two-component system sensor histidine kinase QseC
MWSPEPGAGWSLRRRLALALLLSVGAVLVAMFLVLDHWIDREIYQRMDHALLERARTVSNTLQERDLAQLERLMPEYDPDGHTEFFTVYDAAGHALLRSSSSGGIGLPVGPAARGTPRYYDVVLPDGHAGRALASRLPGPVAAPTRHGQPARLLVVATEREGWDRTERRIHFTCSAALRWRCWRWSGWACWCCSARSRCCAAPATRWRLPADAPPQPIGADFPAELRPFAAARYRPAAPVPRPNASAASPATWPTSCARRWRRCAPSPRRRWPTARRKRRATRWWRR